jgi:hypothetical protein
VSESQARARVGVAVARQQVRAGATPLRAVSGQGRGRESQRFWITARGD